MDIEIDIAGNPRHLIRAAIFHLEEAVMSRSSSGGAKSSALLGDAYLLDNRPMHAIHHLREACAEPSVPPRVQYLLGEAYLRISLFHEAEDLASEALSGFAFDKAFVLRAKARAARGRVAGAVSDVREAIEHGSDSSARVLLAQLLLQKYRRGGDAKSSDKVEARTVLDEVPESDRDDSWHYVDGLCELFSGNGTAALEALSSISFPNETEIAIRRAAALVFVGSFDEADALARPLWERLEFRDAVDPILQAGARRTSDPDLVFRLSDPVLPVDRRRLSAADTVMLRVE